MTVEIQLTKGYVAIVDDCDADLAQYKWNPQVSHNGKVYVSRYVNKDGHPSRELLHRVILERVLGRPLLRSELTDHKDNDGLRNVRSNLRLASHQQNMANRAIYKNSSTGLKGVQYCPETSQSKPYKAIIYASKQRHLLGYFATAEEAHVAYCEAALLYHGEFANFGAFPAPQE